MRMDRQSDRQSDMTKFIVTFRNFAKAPKNGAGIWLVFSIVHDILHVWETKFLWPSEEHRPQGDSALPYCPPVTAAPSVFWLQTAMYG
jgi:hypothetical protein